MGCGVSGWCGRDGEEMGFDPGGFCCEHLPVMRDRAKVLCIPTVEDKGVESRVSRHFGRAPHHVLVDLESLEARALRREGACGGDHGHCLPVDVMVENKVDLVVCKGIGRGAIERLREQRIGVLATAAESVAGVIEEVRRGGGRMGPPRVCGGHHGH